MIQTQYNPDVLSCLANLSNDEVFTPPSLVNQMLDMLPSNLWSNSEAKFLDPVTKSGVFLREIAKRLMEGLEQKIPDKQKRINHIFTQQIYGIAITDLTALLARRSVYCSKIANGKYSICEEFETEQGNILHERMAHTWQQGKCMFCGASQEVYDREDELETYAYNFIHTDNPETIFNMKFDVIIGNPPYQLGSDGGNRDIPIYNKFIEQAKRLNPNYISMIIPARWMAGGLGLNEFRSKMLEDRRLVNIVDFPVSSEVFTGVEVKGGIAYFLWSKDYEGECRFTTVRNNNIISSEKRYLNEYDILVRDNNALPILRKILDKKESSITNILSVDKEFGWTSNFTGFDADIKKDQIPFYYIRKGKRLIGSISRSKIQKSLHLVDSYKVLVPKAGSDGGQKIPDLVLGKPLVVDNPSVCTQSYLFFSLSTKKEALNLKSYYQSKFFRFLVSLRKFTQDATRSTYFWVPIQDFNEEWNDEKLYKKYGLTDEEIYYIDNIIRPMDVA